MPEHNTRRVNEWPEWPNARDWIGMGTFLLTVMLFWMIKEDPTLRQDEFFKTLATLVIGTGFINGVVSWAYSATKGGGELADKNASLVQQHVAPAVPPADAAEAAQQVAQAADDKKDEIVDMVTDREV